MLSRMILSLELCFTITLLLSQVDAGRAKMKNGSVGGLNAATVQNGKVNFKNSVTASVELDGIQSSVELTRNDPKTVSKRPSQPQSNVAVYTSSAEHMTCIEECKSANSDSCLSRCTKHTDEGLVYISGENALLLPKSDGKEDRILDPSVSKPIADSADPGPVSGSKKRRRRSLAPDLTSDIGVIKLLLSVDKSFMDVFMDFVGNDVDAAKAEVELFLVLQTNEMALHYASLAPYNIPYTLNGVSHTLDLTVYLKYLIFPPLNSAGTAFDNIAWSAPHTDGERIYEYDAYQRNKRGYTYLGSGGALVEFGYWLRNEYVGPTDFDIGKALTGYDLVAQIRIYNKRGGYTVYSEEPLVIGTAWLNSVCRDLDATFALNSGITELYAQALSRVMSHEVGHNMGSPHDESATCPSGQNIMGPYLIDPTVNTPNFNTFSICSAQSFADYLSSITSSEYVDCLYNNNPTEAEFLANFCQGVPGSSFGLMEQCQVEYGAAATVCTGGNANLAAGYVPFNGCSQLSSTSVPLFTCEPTSGATCRGIYEVWAGTKCLNSDGTQGTKVCFNGLCQEPALFC